MNNNNWPWQLTEGSFDDWFVLVDAKHQRIADSDIEGNAEEWREIARGLRDRVSISFKRCRLSWFGPAEIHLDSPRNTMGRAAQLSGYAKADELAGIIEAALPKLEAPKLELEAHFTDPTGARLATVARGIDAAVDTIGREVEGLAAGMAPVASIVDAAEQYRPEVSPAPEAERAAAVHMALWKCDLRWPEVTDNAFRLEVPLGAQFKRVYRAKVKERGLYKNVLRMVWLAPTETQRVSFTFALQRMGDVYAVPIVEKPGMLQLGVVDDLDHTPILVWQVPEAAVAAPTEAP